MCVFLYQYLSIYPLCPHPEGCKFQSSCSLRWRPLSPRVHGLPSWTNIPQGHCECADYWFYQWQHLTGCSTGLTLMLAQQTCILWDDISADQLKDMTQLYYRGNVLVSADEARPMRWIPSPNPAMTYGEKEKVINCLKLWKDWQNGTEDHTK